MIPDIIPNALVFKVDEGVLDGAYKDVVADIKRLTKAWVGLPTHEAVFSYHLPGSTRQFVPLSFQVPDDPDAIDEIVSDIPELNRVYPTRNLNWVAENKKKPRQKTRIKKSKPKPDPSNFKYGYDVTKINPKLLHMIEPEARAKGKEFADLLEGFPFAEKTAAENRNFIEFEVIARLEYRFPDIADVNRFLGGAVVRGLRMIADPKNQSRLPFDWHQVFGSMFQHNHPGAWINCCVYAEQDLKLQDYKARKAPQPKARGIVSRYTENAIERDHIVEAAEAFG